MKKEIKVLKKDAMEFAKIVKGGNAFRMFIYLDRVKNKIDVCYEVKNGGIPEIIYNKKVSYRTFNPYSCEFDVPMVEWTLEQIKGYIYEEMLDFKENFSN